MFWLGLTLILLMGLSLGLLGGGGSILAVPILRYVFGMDPRAAIADSLVLVGGTALLAALLQHREGQVDWRGGLIFAAFGAPVSLVGSWASRQVPGTVLMLLFGLLMLVVGALMYRGRGNPPAQLRPRRLAPLAASGAAVGFLTGFLGIGGGFLIVPALVLFLNVPMKRAVGTSLLVIALNAAVAVFGHRQALSGSAGILPALLPLSAVALLGTFAGVWASRRFDSRQLRRLFAVFVAPIGLWMALDSLRSLLQ